MKAAAVTQFIRLVLVAGPIACALAMGTAQAQERPRRVLVLQPWNNYSTATAAIGNAIIERLNKRAGPSLEICLDYLDLNRFVGESAENRTAGYPADKYSSRLPDVVIPVGPASLRFLHRHRQELGFDRDRAPSFGEVRLRTGDRVSPRAG